MSWSEKKVDVIKDGEIVTMSEREAREEELFILREHLEDLDLTSSLPEPEWKLRRGGNVSKNPELVKVIPKWQSYQPEYKKNNVVSELIDNFQWQVSKARREKNLSRLQLANALGVPENYIKLAENGELPKDDFVFVNKLQSYLGINLRRDGRSFDTPMGVPKEASLGPAYVSKPDPNKLSLSDLQKMKEMREGTRKSNTRQNAGSTSMTGSDIELIE